MKNTDTTSTLENVNEIDNNKLISRTDIDGTPFERIDIEHEGELKAFIAWGAHRLTNMVEMHTDEWEFLSERCHKAKNMDWDLIGAFVAAIVTGTINQLQNEKQ